MKKTILSAAMGVGVLTLGYATAEQAQPVTYEENGRQIYLPDFFNRFSPQTASDMVRNIPGFQIRFADSRRGLGQGGANILIDGSRLTGKQTDPLDVLGRTSKSAVERIEIIDGATLGISGLSGPVANVVLAREKRTGNIEWNPNFRKGLAARLTRGSASITGSKGQWGYTVGVENNSFRSGAWGPERITGPSGELLESRYESVENKGESPSASVNLSRKGLGGQETNINGSITGFYFDGSFRSLQFPEDTEELDRVAVFDNGEDEWNTELSADHTFDAFGGRMKLIGFQYFEHSPMDSSAFITDEDGFVDSSLFVRTVDEGETIGRVEQSWDMGDGKSFELGSEVAFNFNDAEAFFTSFDENGVGTPEVVSGGTTRIEELRGEISATYNFPVGKKLDVQASLSGEYSELTQTGDAENERTFTRPKGFVSATYKWTPTVELRGRVERRVGQLSFFAFASSIDLNNGTERLGNRDLAPEQSWFLQAALEKTFADNSQMTITFDWESLEDVVQTVPIEIADGSGGFTLSEGIGNVPEARRWRMEFVGTQMLEKFGIPGGQIEWDLTLRDSEIEDPFSGQTRRLNGETKLYWSVDYRHDIPNTPYAYGFEVSDFKNARNFRSDQTSLYSQSKPAVELYVQHKDLLGFDVSAYVFNILDYTEDFERDIFDGIRPNAEFLQREVRTFDFDPIVGINFSRSF